MRWLSGYLRRYRLQIIVGPVCKLTEAVFELIVPLVMADIIDVGIASGDRSYILRKGGIMVLLGVLGLIFALTCQYLASVASQGAGTQLRHDLFEKINSLSAEDADKIGAPSLITRINSDVNHVQHGIAMGIRLAPRSPFLIIGATVMALMLDVKLSAVFLVAAPLVAGAIYLIMSRTVPFYRVIQKKLDRIALITRENLGGVRVVRAFSKQKHEEKRFNEACDDVARSSIAAGKISALLNPATYAIMNLSIAAIIWFGGFRVDGGAVSQGQIIAFVNYMTQISMALIAFSHLVIIFTRASASAERIKDVFAINPSVAEGGHENTEQSDEAPAIEFRNVSFSYEKNGENALSGLDISIKKGETIGVIGGTGSGKSTLASLIPRFFDADEGEVLVDGVNVREYRFEALRNRIGIVPQRAVLFSGSIADNLRWGSASASEADMWAALSTAQAADFVKKTEGQLSAQVRQGGRNFSGGQRQRLTIARALVRHPQILILDDSASALDYATDRRLREAIKAGSEGMTVIIISQRANSVMNADRIIVLDEGEICGIGTHEELLSNCGEYREIVASQDMPQKDGAL